MAFDWKRPLIATRALAIIVLIALGFSVARAQAIT
jgi:hypothetical protein